MRRALLLFLATLCWLTESEAAELPPLPGPVPLPGPGQANAQLAQKLNAACERCHPEIAAEWRQSYHRQANSDPAFQRALADEPRAFCRRCHAPHADPTQAAAGWAADSGVACVTCHVPGRLLRAPLADVQVLAGARTGPEPPGLAPHELLRDARFSSDGACQGCHEFSFPDGHARRRPELMQSTVSEHRQSPLAGESCIQCHMPRTASGRRSHSFASAHEPQQLRAALRVTATRPTPTLVRLELAPQRVGHALPTGDLFRRLSLRAWGQAADGRRLGQQRLLKRHFGLERQLGGAWVRVTAYDDRLTGVTAIDLPLDAALAGRPLRWQVRYQRVELPLPFSDQARLRPTDDVLLAEGEL